MNTRFIDWIWNVRGSLALGQGQSGEEALSRLSPLFNEPNTQHDTSGDTLTFTKTDPVAQDKLAVFDGGVLKVEKSMAGPLLHYHLTSRFTVQLPRPAAVPVFRPAGHLDRQARTDPGGSGREGQGGRCQAASATASDRHVPWRART